MKDTFLEMNEDDLVFWTDEDSASIRLSILISLTLVVVASLSLMPCFVMSVRVVVVVGLLAEVDFAMILESFVSSWHMLLDHRVQVFEENFYVDRLLLQGPGHPLFLASYDHF